MDSNKIISIENLSISFKTTAGIVNAIRGVDLEVKRGETVAIVGESGSGKSVTTKAVMGILAKNATVNSGKILYKKWMLIGQLQPFDERLYGETVIKDGNYHYLAIRYNATNFSFGIGAFNPFKNVSRTIMENKNAQAPFRRESFSDASRILVATLTWNFNFGKTHLIGTKSLNNQDTDYGIKGSYK